VTELERLAAAVLAQWRHDGGSGGGPIEVSALLDRVLPYRSARRILGIDISEDYEALMLRLIAEEEGIARVFPPDAVELAKETLASRLPDLAVLEQLRSASLTLTDSAVSRLANVLPISTKPESKWSEESVATTTTEPPPVRDAVEKAEAELVAPTVPAAVVACWNCGGVLPGDRVVKFCPHCGADQREPACAACGAATERGWKHCPDCGAKL
jgi:RNA polymerase subunit RPABC4/transcription elongation factor Spt4